MSLTLLDTTVGSGFTFPIGTPLSNPRSRPEYPPQPLKKTLFQYTEYNSYSCFDIIQISLYHCVNNILNINLYILYT